MISFSPISDKQKILGFVSGKGIRRKCAEGEELNDLDVLNRITGSAIYLEAKEGEKSLGMVIFSPDRDGYAIHLCLRTIGQKTRKVVMEAINQIGAKTIYATFKKTNRACSKLCDDLGFVNISTSDTYWQKALIIP